jgi:hypothetical protein
MPLPFYHTDNDIEIRGAFALADALTVNKAVHTLSLRGMRLEAFEMWIIMISHIHLAEAKANKMMRV